MLNTVDVNKSEILLDDLHQSIISERKDGFGIFKVFTYETSRGKTTQCINSSIYSINDTILNNDLLGIDDIGIRTVFVTRFRDECYKFVKKINETTNNSYAIAYIPDEEYCKEHEYCSSNFGDCSSRKIVSITHAAYLNLCIDGKNPRNVFIIDCLKNFNTLIIDEQIDNVKETFFGLNERVTKEINEIFKPFTDINNTFNELVNPLLQMIICYKKSLKEQQNQSTYLHRIIDYPIDDINRREKINKIKSFINSKGLSQQYLEDVEFEYNFKADKSTLQDVIDGIDLIYDELAKNNVLIYSDSIFTYMSNFEFITLKNNIWLDASAEFNNVYNLNSKFFEVNTSKRVIDHSQSNFYFHRENTSKTHKQRDIKDFRDSKIEFIKTHANKDNKILIISSKTECYALSKNYLNEEFRSLFGEVDTTNFHAMRGKNDWKDYNYCFILQTPRMTPAYYVFLYEFWTNYLNENKIQITDNEMVTTKINTNEEWGFKNHNKIQQLMIDDIASSIYQGCKRIARDRTPKGDFHIFCKIDNSVRIVQQQLLNINAFRDGKEGNYDNSNRTQQKYKRQEENERIVKELFLGISNSKERVATKKVIELSGLKTRQQFNRVVKAISNFEEWLSEIGVERKGNFYIAN